MQWIESSPPPGLVKVLAEGMGCSRVLAKILLERAESLADPEEASRFLEPKLKYLECPFQLSGMRGVVDRICRAIEEEETVLVFGDYDVDGITSTAALVHFLREMGLDPAYVVPRRMEEGYGLSRPALERVLEEKGVPDLFVALDCGTNSREEIRYLKAKGADVIVVDHHQGREGELAECLLINPHLNHDPGVSPPPPWLHLCTAGLIFKLIHGLIKHYREAGHPLAGTVVVAEYLDLAGMGTVADLVPLSGENRLIARHGLLRLARTRRPGLHALFKEAGIEAGEILETADISFKIGPRINAVGRLDDARLPVEMLLGSDYRQCHEIARNLDALNRERKTIEGKIFEEARELIETSDLREAAGIVVSMPHWHHGVVGIVASRLTYEYHRPCLVLGGAEADEESTLRKGSGRSIPGVDLVRVLEGCRDLLEHWGGHPMAVGLTLEEDRLEALQAAFAKQVKALFPDGLPDRVLPLADWVDPGAISVEFLRELDRLRPFGQGNPRPIFGIRPVILESSPRILKQQHFRFQMPVPRGRPVPGIAWNMGGRVPPVGKAIEMAGRLGWNTWKGKRTLQLELVDWRRSPQ